MLDLYNIYINRFSLFDVLISNIDHAGLREKLEAMQVSILKTVKSIDPILKGLQGQHKEQNDKEAIIKMVLNRIETINSHILESSQYVKENTINDEAKEDAKIIIGVFSDFFDQVWKDCFSKLQVIQPKVSDSITTLLDDVTNLDTENLLQTLKNIDEHFKFNGYRQRSCFISYAWPNKNDPENFIIEEDMQQFLKKLRMHLRAAGIITYLDIEDKNYESVYQYAEKVQGSNYILLIGTESLLKEHQRGLSNVTDQLISIKRKRMGDKLSCQHIRVFPLLLSGSIETSFPENFECYSGIKDWRGVPYLISLKDLIRAHYGETKDNIGYERLWDAFEKSCQNSLSKPMELLEQSQQDKEKTLKKGVAYVETENNANIKISLENSPIRSVEDYYVFRFYEILAEAKAVENLGGNHLNELFICFGKLETFNSVAYSRIRNAVQSAKIGAKTFIHIVAKANHFEMLMFLLELKVDIDEQDGDDKTALHYAAEINSEIFVLNLLAAGASPDKNSVEINRTAAQIAAANGYIDVLKILMRRKDVDFSIPLYRAVFANQRNIVYILVKSLKLDINHLYEFKGHIKKTLLYAACENSNEYIINFLLDQKEINVNLQSIEGEMSIPETPLHIAIKKNRLVIIMHLLSKDITIDGYAIYLAAERGYADILELLLQRKNIDINMKVPIKKVIVGGKIEESYDKILNVACRNQHIKSVNLLLSLRAKKIIISDADGNYSAVHIACQTNNIEILKLLTHDTFASERKQCLNQKILSGGKAPLHTCVDANSKDCLKHLLLFKDIDINQTDDNKNSALLIACQQLKYNLISELLLHPFIDVNKENEQHETPLNTAILKNDINILDMLINVNSLDLNSPLQKLPIYFAIKSSTEIFEKLLDCDGIDLTLQDVNGKTVLGTAFLRNDLEKLYLLMEYKKINLNQADKDGNTLLHLLCAKSNLELLEKVLKYDSVKSLPNEGGCYPIFYAIKYGLLDVITHLIKSPLKLGKITQYDKFELSIEIMFQSIQFNKPDIFNVLKQEHQALAFNRFNSMKKYIDRYGYLLNKAVELQHIHFVADLLELEFDSSREVEPLYLKNLFTALKLDDFSIAQLLIIKLGRAINVYEIDNNKTILYYSIELNREKIFNYICQQKIDPNLGTVATKITPLHLCASAPTAYATVLLTFENIETNSKNVLGETPLHYAVKNKNYKMIELLLDRDDIKVNIKDNEEFTALSRACDEEDNQSINLLLGDIRSKIDDNFEEGTNPLHIVIKKKNLLLIEKLIDSFTKKEGEIKEEQQATLLKTATDVKIQKHLENYFMFNKNHVNYSIYIHDDYI